MRATTARRSRCTSRARRSPRSSTCPSRRPPTSSRRCPPSPATCSTLNDVGLGYVRLGQPAPTLSGGEAQRVKLASELQKRSTGRTVYVLDEPTTGLHFDDIRKLLGVLQGLTDKGNTVIVIEHNLDVIKTADWIIDMGPEGGSGGGLVVAEGTPEDIAVHPTSYTGMFLAPVLAERPASRTPAQRAAPRPTEARATRPAAARATRALPAKKAAAKKVTRQQGDRQQGDGRQGDRDDGGGQHVDGQKTGDGEEGDGEEGDGEEGDGEEGDRAEVGPRRRLSGVPPCDPSQARARLGSHGGYGPSRVRTREGHQARQKNTPQGWERSQVLPKRAPLTDRRASSDRRVLQ